MADINLLQSSGMDDSDNDKYYLIFNILGYVLLAAAIAFGGYQFYHISTLDKQIQGVYAEQQAIKGGVEHNSNYTMLISDQAKVVKLKTLLNNHFLWSKVLPDFFQATLKTAVYKGFTANKDGSVTITGVVANFQDLDRLVKGFELADFKSYIKEVKLINVGLASEGQTKITYTLNVTFNKDILANK